MLNRTPVLAVNNGGPLETVVEGQTGWLRPADEKEWCGVMKKVLFEMTDEEIQQMGELGRIRVEQDFSKEKMALNLQKEMFDMLENEVGVSLVGFAEFGVLMGVVVGLVATAAYLHSL